MDIEIIKKVKLLVTLKGTEGGKQQLWLVGTVFDRDVKPFPTTIIEEIQLNRIPPAFKVLEYTIVPPSGVPSFGPSESPKDHLKEQIPEVQPIVPTIHPTKAKKEKPEVPKDVSSKPKTRKRRR
jgi:hypothetical protein